MNVEQNSNAGTFPSGDHRGVQPEYGLTKREYFAGQTLQGIVSNQEFLKNLNAEPKIVVKAILEITDELLKQLSE